MAVRCLSDRHRHHGYYMRFLLAYFDRHVLVLQARDHCGSTECLECQQRRCKNPRIFNIPPSSAIIYPRQQFHKSTPQLQQLVHQQSHHLCHPFSFPRLIQSEWLGWVRHASGGAPSTSHYFIHTPVKRSHPCVPRMPSSKKMIDPDS